MGLADLFRRKEKQYLVTSDEEGAKSVECSDFKAAKKACLKMDPTHYYIVNKTNDEVIRTDDQGQTWYKERS